MSSFAKSLDQEIARSIQSALRKALKPIQAALTAEQKRVAKLEKEVARLRKAKGLPAKKLSAARVKATGESAAKVATLRDKYALSQRAVSLLLDVSLNTVWLWEQGRTNPRAAQAGKIDQLLTLGPAAMRNRLAKVGLSEGKSKPGRKPGSRKKVAAKAPKKASKRVAKKAKRAKATTKK